MGDKSTYGLKILYAAVMGVLLFPLMQQQFHLVKEKPLNGSVVEKAPVFSVAPWFKEDFQLQWDTYYTKQFGLRNTAVRLNNQLDFWLFSKANAKGVIIGKQGYIYEENYVNAYTGKDFEGFAHIYEKMRKLKCIQDTLQKLNKHVLVILAPGKASYFPEYIPETYLKKQYPFKNIDVYRKVMSAYHIPYLDFNSWFIKNKTTAAYPLYGKCGIHWSKYAEALVADSFIRFMQTQWNASLTNYVLDSVRVSAQNVDGDYDAGDGLNLLYPISTYPMAYPYFHFTTSTEKKKTKVMMVSDSYYWGLYNYGLSKDVFNDGQFWYYNEEIYSQEFKPNLRVLDATILDEIRKHDIIVLMATDANLFRFGFMFIENVYDAFYTSDPTTSTVKKVRRAYFLNQINNDGGLMQLCKEKALQEGTTLETEMLKLAEYKVWEEINRYNGNTTP